MNTIIISGNITRNLELRHTPKGQAVCQFSIAANRRWTSDTGEKKEEVSFFDVTAFGRQAETIAKYFGKGKPILVSGRLKQETWKDKNDQSNRSKVGIILEGFEFMDRGEKKDSAAPTAPAPASAPAPDDDSDVPF